jgi:hypothetical protein
MRRTALIALCLLAISIAACSVAPRLNELSSQRVAPAPTAASVGGATEARSAAPASSSVSIDTATGAPGARPAPQAPNSSGTLVNLPPLDRMIIRNVTMMLSVDDVSQAFQQVEMIAASVGGSVTGSSLKQEGERTSASMMLRIPADQRTYNSTMEQLRKLAVRVPEESLSSQDVTEEFVDLESTLRNLQATEARLVSLMERAQKVDEVMAVQREITNVRGQIERIEGRRRFLERRSELTTINLTLRDAAAPTLGQPRGWSPAATFEEAFTALTRSMQLFARVGIWLIVWLPVYGVAIAAIWWLLRQLRRRREPAAV